MLCNFVINIFPYFLALGEDSTLLTDTVEPTPPPSPLFGVERFLKCDSISYQWVSQSVSE